MIKQTVLAAVLLSPWLMGCSSPPSAAPSTTLAESSFEQLDGWATGTPALATLTREQAHTGAYSTKVGPSQEFSLGYENQLSKLAPDWPAKLVISGWVLLPNEQAKARLVTEVKGASNTAPGLLWEGLDLAKAVKEYNKWQYVEQTITMPPAAKPDSRLLVYLWRADSKQPVYLDDLKISLPK